MTVAFKFLHRSSFRSETFIPPTLANPAEFLAAVIRWSPISLNSDGFPLRQIPFNSYFLNLLFSCGRPLLPHVASFQLQYMNTQLRRIEIQFPEQERTQPLHWGSGVLAWKHQGSPYYSQIFKLVFIYIGSLFLWVEAFSQLR